MKLSRSKAFAFQEGRCPETGDRCEFKISTQKINWIHKYGTDDKFFNLRNVPFALDNPNAIFKGLKRDGHEKSYCYVANPERRFINDESTKPVEPGMVFVVFILSTLEVFDWDFVEADSSGRLPENHEGRFTELIWENKP